MQKKLPKYPILFFCPLPSPVHCISYNGGNQQRFNTSEILTALRLLAYLLQAYFLISHSVAIPNTTREKHIPVSFQ